MKKGWVIKKLGEVCDISLGKTPHRSEKSFWDIENKTKNIWLSIADLLNTDGLVVSDSKEYITDKAAAISKVVKKGTLLVSFKLTLGRLAFAGCDLFTNEAIASLTIKNENEIDKFFLYKYLLFFDWDKAAEGDVKVKGKTLNKAKLKEIKIKYPKSLPEQQRIVSILDKSFVAIDKAKANAEQNLQNAKELFESYLQGVFEKKGDGWEEKKLGESCELSAGGDVPKDNFSKIKTEKHLFPIFANGEKNEGLYGYTSIAKVLKPSITVSARGTIGYSVKRLEPFFPVVRLIVVTPKDLNKIDLDFLSYAVKTIKFKHSGSSIPQLTVPMIKDYIIPFPPLKEQQTIVRQLDALRAETQKLEAVYQKKIADLEELKKSILQKAFAGELK